MTGNRVFLVHGMGSHPPGWSEAWQQAFALAAGEFAPYAAGGRALADDVTFVEVGYDDVFETYRARWHDLASALGDAALPAPLQPVFAALAQQGDGKVPAYFWTHLLDVLLWFGLAQAREAVIAAVAAQLVDGLVTAIDAGARAHIVAHSLGTSVVHDTLLCLTDPKYASGQLDPEVGGRRWDSLLTFANVSRLLQATRSPSSRLPASAFDPLTSRVNTGPNGLLRDFVVARHRLDPFTFVRTFEPPAAAGLSRFALRRYRDLADIHALETLLANPGVAAVCLRSITGDRAFGTDAEIAAAMPRYDQQMPETDAAFATLAGALAGNAGTSFGDVAKAVLAIVRELDGLRRPA
jgi:hypothetical protein